MTELTDSRVTSLRLSAELYEMIGVIADHHRWTRSQAMQYLLEYAVESWRADNECLINRD